MGCGSGSTCWRRLVEWERAGVWRRLHETLLAELRRRGRLDQRWTVVDSGSVRAMRGRKTGPNPTDRRKAGSKHHIANRGARGDAGGACPPQQQWKPWWPGIGESCCESLPPTLCVDALGGHLARRWGALLRHLRLPRLGHQARL